MEAPELTCPVSPARIRPAPAPGPQGPRRAGLTAPDPGPVILPPPEQGLAPAMFLKALPVPLHHTVPPGGLQPRTPLVTGGLDGGGGAFLLSPLLQPEGPSPAAAGKPTLAVSIVGALPVLSPGLGPALGSPGRVRGAGRYLCPHCGRDCLKPSVLEKHVRSHTGERPFPCATCGVAFKTQSNLYKHRRTQTHLNNARLAAQSGGAGGLPEGVAKAGEPSGTDSQEDPGGQGLGDGAPRGTAPSPGALAAAHLSPAVAKSWEVKLDTAAGLGPPGADREALGPAVLPAGAQPRWKLPEQKSPTAVKPCPSQPPQPQAASAEKSWEAKAPEGQLRKCESTDSGYLSRSDSAEQPLAPCSPLHGPWEHGGPAEGEGTPGPGERGASLGLEKKQLEERIARLISHNQAVVDDPQLDHVRPRKSGLSKQGSIDLPAPHTYRGSFHFDIRAREPGCRRPAPLCPARSTLAPLDRSRPLFFHSVPTQLSTTVECVPVTRSNSLPFLDGTRTWQELQDPQGGCPLRQRPLSPRPAPGPRGASSGLAWVGVPSGHPRALIRQAAVEDRPGTPPGDAAAPAEDPEGARAARGRAATRKPQAFSQDKWQVYGSETFQRIYQKTKTSRQGGKKAKAARTGGRAGPPLPRQEEAAGRLDPTPPQGAGTPVCGGVSAGAAPSPRGGLPASDGRVENRLPERRDVAAGAGSRGRSSVDRAASPTALGCREGPGLGGKDAQPPPLGQLEQGCPPLPAPGPLDPESPGPVLTGAEVGGDTHGAGPVEPGQRAPGGLRRPGRGPAEPQPAEDKLPSERKKLKVAEQSGQEWPEPLGGGAAPAGPPQPAPLPSESRDSGPAEKPGGPRGSPHSLAEAAASVALQSVGPGDTEPPRCAAAVTPEPCAPPAPRAQAPGVLASRPDTTFAPKYLLRLPQGEVPPDPPSPRAKDPRCSRGRPGECPFSTGPPLPPGPVPGPDPGGADCLDQRTGVQEEDRGDLADTSTLTAGEPLGSAAEAHGGPVSFRTTPSDTQHLCVGSTLPRAGPSGEARDPWVPSKELGAPPENALDDPPSGAHPRGCLRPSWPEPASSAHSATPWSCGAQGPFPTLRAEPRLTWCCLSRSLPLPAEQKGRAASVYLALHCPGSSPPGEGRDTRPVSKAAPAPRGQSSTSQDGGGPAWLPKVTAAVGWAGEGCRSLLSCRQGTAVMSAPSLAISLPPGWERIRSK
ncbi:Zinc finger protein 831 [Galemys pyrenaicus]|uniref:Zinc finger protein 831 n=1 Tax=Galemys pyrenaicus TaxID=202257 RepID=A0A8J6DML4_GALPY|nr:Zinc finger protein 831 [Galemys pyrenaicus]